MVMNRGITVGITMAKRTNSTPKTHKGCLALCVPGPKQRAYGLGPGTHGLRLVVGPTGTGAWAQRLWQDGRCTDRGLGPIGYVTLAQAKRLAFENKAAKWINRTAAAPAPQRRPASPTFETLAQEVIAERAGSLKNARQSSDWTASLERWVFPLIGSARVAALTRSDLLRVFEQEVDGKAFWTARSAMSKAVLRRVRVVLDKAVAREYLLANPCDKALEAGLPKANGKTKHHGAIAYADLPAALAKLDDSTQSLAARLVALTAVRSVEAAEAHWSEIDFKARTWTIPADRMKAGREHQVPLSDAALDVLRDARKRFGRTGHVFLGANGKVLNRLTIMRPWRRAGNAGTIHGLRSAFRDWCGETGQPREIAEACLAHTVKGVEGSYARSSLLERRRQVMHDWAAFLSA